MKAVAMRYPLKTICLAALAAVATTLLPLEANAAKRIALVIGNSSYEHLSKLANPKKDASAIAAQLRKNGFAVFEHHNLSRADFLDALEEFRDKASSAELAVVYYAGHGMEVAGRDILAPTDMQISCEQKKARRSVRLRSLFEAASGAKNQVVLLDSCRNDPFPQCPTRGSDTGGGFRGLSRVDAGAGAMLIANATLSGSLANDGKPGEHSPFATALLKQFTDNPNIYFRDMLDQVAVDVRRASNGQQVPEITARGGSPRMCLSASDCVQLASLPGGINQNPSVVTKPPKIAEPQNFSVGESFKDCEDCPDMVVLPAGTFTMGSDRSEVGHKRTEAPRRDVTIARPFAVSKLEITYDQWETCLLEGGCNGHKPRAVGGKKGNLPVAYVSYDDARAYVSWLRQTTGKPYRLLSEAEWEYAARGGTTSAFATGAAISTDQANFDGTFSAGQGKRGVNRGKAIEGGTFPPNPFGLFDMHGNLAEWVEDCWTPNHASASGDGSVRGGDCNRRVVKGGAWYFEPEFARSAARQSYPKTKRLPVVGFRVARPLE